MSSGLFRIGRWCFRHRRIVVAGWARPDRAPGGRRAQREAADDERVQHPGNPVPAGARPVEPEVPRHRRRAGTGRLLCARAGDAHRPRSPPGSRGDTGRAAKASSGRGRHGSLSALAPCRRTGRIAYAIVAYPVPVANVTSAAQTALLNSGGPAKAAGITVNFGGRSRRPTRRPTPKSSASSSRSSFSSSASAR